MHFILSVPAPSGAGIFISSGLLQEARADCAGATKPAQAAIERGRLAKQTRGAHRRAPRKSQPSCPIQSLQIFSKSCQEFALVFCPSSRQSKHYFQPKPHFRFPTPIRSQNRVYHSEKQNGIYTRNMLCIEKRDSI